LSTPERKTIASIVPPSSTAHTTAWPLSDSYDENFLHRLVVCGSGGRAYLGIIEDVSLVGSAASCQNELTIRNLLSLEENGKPVPVGNVPNVMSQVSFASENHLDMFFPRQEFPKKGYFGLVRETSYPLPFDLDNLCFANTAILAGIKHGKSHLAALVASQLHLAGKKVLVIDPTGEWKSELMDWIKTMFPSIAVSHHTMLAFPSEGTAEENQLASLLESVFESEKESTLTIMDVAFAEEVDKLYSAVDAVKHRCGILIDIQRALMRRAQKQYAKFTRGLNTCILIEEAHEFVPNKPLAGISEIQEDLSALFSISTKEFRKYGLGHIFIDQSLGSISADLQIRTYFLGAIGGPRDFKILEARLGGQVASAAQRTIGGTENPSWIVYGTATPMPTIPWEIVLTKPENLPLLVK
jgi:hypothetical protein